jgi:hypothetical protein
VLGSTVTRAPNDSSPVQLPAPAPPTVVPDVPVAIATEPAPASPATEVPGRVDGHGTPAGPSSKDGDKGPKTKG